MFRDVSLAQTIENLSTHPDVMGILLIGSTANQLKSHSDLDILIIVKDGFPIDVALTYIDNRLTDLVFRPVTLLENFPQVVQGGTSEASIVNWFRTGKIVFDHDGTLKTIQEQATAVQIVPNENFRAGAQFGVLYNYHQNLRLWRSGDQLYHEALQMRLLYALSDIMISYFYLRGETWTGEKDAIRYWQAHDADYYHLFRTTMSTTDLNEKFALYEQLVELTLQPVGGLIKENLPIIQPVDWQDSNIKHPELSALLRSLLADQNSPID
ncbi:MAG: hypothetical protein L0154_05135 [Chloroflexi bacterium]|nr:hypothetical protein [Chloroflexota bacterium]